MKLEPNLNRGWRVIYVVVGAGLVVTPLALALPGWERFLLPVLGLMAVATGATGW